MFLFLGFTRSFGMRLPNGERREWIKPIMFTGGIGLMDHDHAYKNPVEVGTFISAINNISSSIFRFLCLSLIGC